MRLVDGLVGARNIYRRRGEADRPGERGGGGRVVRGRWCCEVLRLEVPVDEVILSHFIYDG